jgi:hypothetical protein
MSVSTISPVVVTTVSICITIFIIIVATATMSTDYILFGFAPPEGCSAAVF